MDRRTFLTRGAGALGAAALVRPSALTIGSKGLRNSSVRETAAELAKSSSTPKRGGSLVIGSLGSIQDTLDNQLYASSNMDQERGQNLYDTLTYLDKESFIFHPALAEHIEMSPDAKVATFYLRKGVEFHSGKTLMAEDLIFSLQRIMNPAHYGKSHTSLAAINPNALTAVNDYTVTATLNYADAMMPERFTAAQVAIYPVDWDPTAPVGTGAFMYKSFTPGSQSVFVRNPNYWMEGKPYLDELTIIDFDDDPSRVAALLAGQINAIDGFDPSLKPELEAAGSKFSTMLTKSGYYQPITMRVDLPPFNDARVRQAFRLMVDRPGMVKQGYGNLARIANDMPDPGDPAYPKLPQRVQDLDKAKALLKAAGYGSGLNVTLTTSPEDVDLVNSALVFAQQVQEANIGVTVTVNQITNSAYNVGFTKWPFTQGYWAAGIIGTGFSGRFIPGSSNNDSHWNDPKQTAIYYNMLAQTDPVKRRELQTEILKTFYEEGPDIVHTFKDGLDAFTKNFHFTPSNSNGWNLGGYLYRDAWSD